SPNFFFGQHLSRPDFGYRHGCEGLFMMPMGKKPLYFTMKKDAFITFCICEFFCCVMMLSYLADRFLLFNTGISSEDALICLILSIGGALIFAMHSAIGRVVEIIENYFDK
uniref:hypothetical protein n=1 Tax=Sphingomonas sp. 37zxx TaxID=1550073 RepID=UPI0018CF1A9B